MTHPEFEMMLLAQASLREVLHNSADIHDFQTRADGYLEAVRRAVENAHHLYRMQHEAQTGAL